MIFLFDKQPKNSQCISAKYWYSIIFSFYWTYCGVRLRKEGVFPTPLIPSSRCRHRVQTTPIPHISQLYLMSGGEDSEIFTGLKLPLRPEALSLSKKGST